MVRNAAEAMQDMPRRELLISATSDGDKQIEVSVADTGPGLAPQMRAHLFEPFFTTKGAAMGIGLSICRSIVKAHGGQLWAEDNSSRGGTVFRTPCAAPGTRMLRRRSGSVRVRTAP